MKATQPPKSPHLVFPLRLFLAFQMLPPQLFPDLSAPSGSLPGSSTWSLFSSSLLSSLPLLVNSESWIQLSNPPLRCTLRVLCSLSFWDTHGGKQLHLLQAYSRLPRQSWERWCNLAEHFNSCFFYRNRALHCLEIHYVSCELFASHIFDNIISNLYFSPQTFLCSLVLIDSSEKIETIWWKQPQLPANESSARTASVPTVPASFLFFGGGAPPPFKGLPSCFSLHPTCSCFLKTLCSGALPSHSSVFNCFSSPIGPASQQSCLHLSSLSTPPFV